MFKPPQGELFSPEEDFYKKKIEKPEIKLPPKEPNRRDGYESPWEDVGYGGDWGTVEKERHEKK